MTTPVLTAKGNNGEVTLFKDKIRITRKKGLRTFILHGIKGDKDILISEITSIQFKEPGITVGFIQFGFRGGIDAGKGVFQAVKDENTVTFLKKELSQFVELKQRVEARMAEYRNPSQAKSGLDDIEKLHQLKEKGILTEDEFNTKKRQLLGI